jgi:hypothetical protein
MEQIRLHQSCSFLGPFQLRRTNSKFEVPALQSEQSDEIQQND